MTQLYVKPEGLEEQAGQLLELSILNHGGFVVAGDVVLATTLSQAQSLKRIADAMARPEQKEMIDVISFAEVESSLWDNCPSHQQNKCFDGRRIDGEECTCYNQTRTLMTLKVSVNKFA